MPKKRNDEDIWGENTGWGEEDESWDYKPPRRDAGDSPDFDFNPSPSDSYRESSGRSSFDRKSADRRFADRRFGDPDSLRDQRRDYAERHSPGSPPPPPARRPRAPQKKSKIVYFYIGTLLIAVSACLVLFAMAFQTMTKNNNPVTANTPEETETTAPPAQGEMQNERNTRQFCGLVTSVELDPNKITLLDINTSRNLTYDILDNTNIKDRFGTALSVSELRRGMILDVGYHSQTSALMSLAESTQAMKLDFRTNLKIDLETSTIKLGNDTYTYNSQTVVQSKGELYPISQITENDTVSLTVYGKNVWNVQLEGSHGFLAIENADKVVGGVLSAGTSVFMSLDDITEPVTLAEGTHSILIEGQNIEPFIQTAVIAPGETFTINLIDVELKPGSLLVTVSEPDSEIIIDGVLLTEPGPTELPFGTHTVRVEKDGFLPMEQTVEINTDYRELNIELTKLLLNAKLIINTIPSPAEIYFDNVFVGHSPWTQDVEVGTHTVTVRLYGYNDSTITFDVVEGENRRDLMLTQASSDPFAHLPVPDDTQPVVDEMIIDPTIPEAYPTATPAATPTPAPSGQVFEETEP